MKQTRKRLRTARRLSFQPLNQRALLAVIAVAPQPNDNPTALFAEAIAKANSTPEADTIELAASEYDLALLGTGTITIDSEIKIVGVSPSETVILAAPGVPAIEVTQGGSLDLERLTIFASAEIGGGALNARGNARLDTVAVVGLTDGTLRSDLQYQQAALIGAIDLEINNSIIVDSPALAINTKLGGASDGSSLGGGNVKIENTIISGAASRGVQTIAETFTLANSTVFDNGRGVAHFGFNSDVQISNVTITGNHNRVGIDALDFSGPFEPSDRGTPGLSVASPGRGSSVSIASNSVINGNQLDSVLPEISVIAISDETPRTLGTLAQAAENVAAVSVTTEVLEGQRLLISDRVLEGVNVILSQNGARTVVQATQRGSSSVFWSAEENQFFVESNPRSSRELIDISDTLVPLDAGRIVGGESPDPIALGKIALSRTELTSSERNTWQLFRPTELFSEAGAPVRFDPLSDELSRIQYHPPADFEGVDTITIRGLDVDGQEVEGTITIEVTLSTDINVNVAAAELNDIIEVAISNSGFKNITGFAFDIEFDPSQVELIDTEFGREFPFLREVQEGGAGRVNVSAIGGLSRGSDLVMLRFQRIGEGSAAIGLVSEGFEASALGRRFGLESFGQVYYYLSQDDVNRDGSVTARDSLNVVNQLSVEPAESEGGQGLAAYDRDLDTNGDGSVSASDALRIVNRLSRESVPDGEAVMEGSSQAEPHPIFNESALAFHDPSDPIPRFVGRPGLPIDNGTPLESVDLTAPTREEQESSEAIDLTRDGVSIERSLVDDDDSDLFLIRPSSRQLGFGLTPVNTNGQPRPSESDLTLVFFNNDGDVIAAFPTAATSSFIGGVIDAPFDEPIYARVGTTNSEAVDYRLELLEFGQ